MSDDELNRQSSGSSGTERHQDLEHLCVELEGYVRAKPFRAVIIALCVGILIGKIIL